MVLELINGRGQLGAALGRYASDVELNATVYHTWDILDKSLGRQREEFRKYERFMAQRTNPSPLIFISTKTANPSFYLEYKQLAEALTLNYDNTKVIRIPTLIGRGICDRFIDEDAEAFGNMELLTVDDAARQIVSSIESEDRIISLSGINVQARLAKELLRYGFVRGKNTVRII